MDALPAMSPVQVTRLMRSTLVRPIIDGFRKAAPYAPVPCALPDGRTIRRHFGDVNVPRIVEEVFVARVYESVPGFAPRSGETVLDAGAHIGVYAIHAAELVGAEGLVVAVEAEPRNFALLRRNLRSVRGARTKCVNCALWSKLGHVTLHRDASRFGAHSVVFHVGDEPIQVRAETLDGLVRSLNLPNLSLIKMDVEGAALEILRGGVETLSKLRPRVACAAYHTPDEARLVTAFLQPLGYAVETLGVRHSYSSVPEAYVFAKPR